MATELTNGTNPPTVDLTGLPEPVAQEVRQLVKTLRENFSRQESSPPGSERPSLRGRFADLKLSIPTEDLDEAQREAWSGFPRDFPEPGKS